MLNTRQEEWLNANGYRLVGEIHPDTIPILVEDPDSKPVCLTGYGCVSDTKRAHFIAEAIEGLWLGGGAVMVRVPEGIVTIPDRRHGGNAGPAAMGWAKYDEGQSLDKTAAREFTEELTIFALAGKGDGLCQTCTEIVPAGVKPKGYVRSLNQALAEVEVYGRLEFLTWSKDEKDRAWIYVAMWDLRNLPRAHRLRVIWNDDLPNLGSNPRVLSVHTGWEVGRYEGAQGYLPNDLEFHAVLRDWFQRPSLQ